MDKYANILKLEEIKRLSGLKKYDKAFKIVETIDVNKIRSMADLTMIAEVYEKNGLLDDAIHILLRIYDRSSSRRIIYQLTRLNIRKRNLEEAEKFYDEYLLVAPRDSNKYILRFYLDRAKGEPMESLIKTLEELKRYDYIEEWAYELAKLYHKAGEKEKCLNECSEIILLFGDGLVVEKAKYLREHYLGTQDEEAESATKNKESQGEKNSKPINVDYMSSVEMSLQESLKSLGGQTGEEAQQTDEKEGLDAAHEIIQNIVLNNEEVSKSAIDDGVNPDINRDMETTKDLSILKSSQMEVESELTNSEEDNRSDHELPIDSEHDKYNQDMEESIDNNLVIENESILGEESDVLNIDDQIDTQEEYQGVSNGDDLSEESTSKSTDSSLDDDNIREAIQNESDKVLELFRQAEEILKETEGIIKETEVMADMNSTEDKNIAKSMDSAENMDFDGSIGSIQDTNLYDSINPSKKMDLTEDINSTVDMEQTESRNSVYNMGSIENMKATEDINPAQTTDPTESSNPSAYTDTTENMQTKENYESTDDVKAAEYITKENPIYTHGQIPEEEDSNIIINDIDLTSIFENFTSISNIKGQLIPVLNNMALQKINLSLVMAGAPVSGKTTLSKMIAKALYKLDILSTPKIAKITAAKLNNIELKAKYEQLSGCCVIIEQAGDLGYNTVIKVIEMIQDLGQSIMVILEDRTEKINELFFNNPRLKTVFENNILMPDYTFADLRGFAFQYFKEQELNIEEDTTIVLDDMISQVIEQMNPEDYLYTVMDIVKNAATASKNRDKNKLKNLVQSNKYNEAEFSIVTVNDLLSQNM